MVEKEKPSDYQENQNNNTLEEVVDIDPFLLFELDQDQRERLFSSLVKAKHLEEESGVIFRRAPDNFYPGMPYVTPDDLAESGITGYSISQINRLGASGEINIVRFDRKILLSPLSVQMLLEREQKSITGELDQSGDRRGGGRRAGAGKPHNPRRKNPWPTE